MGRDYRKEYAKNLGVYLTRGSSIHHIDSDRKNCKIINLVAIPEELHQRLNITFSNFPKVLKNIMKVGNYLRPRIKHLNDLKKCIADYEELQTWIDIRNIILKSGIKYVIEIYGQEKISQVYKIGSC